MPCWSLEPETLSWSLIGGRSPKFLRYLLLLPQVCFQGAGSKIAQLWLELVFWYGMLELQAKALPAVPQCLPRFLCSMLWSRFSEINILQTHSEFVKIKIVTLVQDYQLNFSLDSDFLLFPMFSVQGSNPGCYIAVNSFIVPLPVSDPLIAIPYLSWYLHSGRVIWHSGEMFYRIFLCFLRTRLRLWNFMKNHRGDVPSL